MGKERNRTRFIYAQTSEEYHIADEGYRDGFGDGIRRRTRRRRSRWQFLTLDRRMRSAYWGAYDRGYDDGGERAGRNGRVIIVDEGEGTGAV